VSPEPSVAIVLSLAQAAGLATSLGGALVATIVWLFNRLLAQVEGRLEDRFAQAADDRTQFERRLDERFQVVSAEGELWRELERNFLSLRAELPEKYVRREDYIRGQTVIEAKLDAIGSELKLVQIQGARSAHG
jgi:hypothetical protein